MVTNGEIKDIMKVIKSLEKRGTISKGTTRKIISQEGRFINFFKAINGSWFTINEKFTHNIS